MPKLGLFTRQEYFDLIKDSKHVSFLPDLAVSKSVDYITENYPFSDIKLDQFKSIIESPSSSMKRLPQSYNAYNVVRSSDNVDHWVAESLKRFDRSLYDKMYGYTKKTRLGRAYAQLIKFSRPIHTSRNLNSDSKFKTCYQRALNDVKALFKGKKFPTLTIPDFMKQIPQNTGAGFPYQGKKKSEVWSEVHRKSISNYFQLVETGKLEPHPFTLALRGHLSPVNELKTRPIWLSPFEHIVMENVLFRHLYDFVFSDEDMSNLILTGKRTLHRLRNYLSLDTGGWYFNLDYSAWDAWRCRFVGLDLFKIFKEIIDFKPGEERILYFVRKQFLDSKLLLPDGSCYEVSGGTPTGSLLTALFNSLMNFICFKTCVYSLEVEHYVEHLRILGDDLSFYYDGHIEPKTFLDRLAELLKYLFDLKISPHKCLVVEPWSPIENKKFIGYSLRGNQLYKPEEDFFLSVLYPEHDVKNVIISFSRVFSYYLLGGIFHDKFTSWFRHYMRVYWHILSKENRLVNEQVFKMGNLRVIKHVFQIEVDVFLSNFDVVKFQKIDFLLLPYFFNPRF